MIRDLAAQMVELHRALEDAAIAHGFGGALALAWCVGSPRGTADVDVNIFLDVSEAATALGALPDGIHVTEAQRGLIARDGQARLWWDGTPVDVFFNTTPFHREVAGRVRHEAFGETVLPFLDCSDLAVFKAFFDRGKARASQHQVDLEEMVAAGTLDVERVLGTLVRHLGGDDPRIERLRSLTAG